MKGKVCIVTGSNNGIGFATAKDLAGQGVQVVMICRSQKRGEKARRKIEQATGNLPDLLLADLASQQQIKQVAQDFRAQYDRLDVLINNAGFAFSERDVTDEGFERTFALNYLGYFTLTLELIDLLIQSAPSRIVNITSSAHRWEKISFDNLQGEKSFPLRRYPPLPIMYGWTNMYRILFTYELAEQLQGTGVTANCLCPGFVPVHRSSATKMQNLMATFMMRLMPNARTPEEAAKTIVYLAGNPEAEKLNGTYHESGRLIRSAPQSYDEAVRRQLWETTLALTGYTHNPIATARAQVVQDEKA